MKDMRVRDVMTHLVVTFRPDESVHEAARRLAQNHISGGPVVEQGNIVGILSEYDIVRAIVKPLDRKLSFLDFLSRDAETREDRAELKVKDVMTRRATVIHDDATIWDAATSIERHGVKRLPVIDDAGQLAGIVSRADLVRVMGRTDSTIRSDVIEAVGVLGEDTIGELVVTCLNGSVTLSGRVDRKTTHTLAIRLAARIPGVVRVRDRLEHEWDDSKLRLPTPSPDPRMWAVKP